MCTDFPPSARIQARRHHGNLPVVFLNLLLIRDDQSRFICPKILQCHLTSRVRRVFKCWIEQIEIRQFVWSHRFILKGAVENLITKEKSWFFTHLKSLCLINQQASSLSAVVFPICAFSQNLLQNVKNKPATKHSTKRLAREIDGFCDSKNVIFLHFGTFSGDFFPIL
jgi:hypothetical protein